VYTVACIFYTFARQRSLDKRVSEGGRNLWCTEIFTNQQTKEAARGPHSGRSLAMETTPCCCTYAKHEPYQYPHQHH
jgi:hypothetical protein